MSEAVKCDRCGGFESNVGFIINSKRRYSSFEKDNIFCNKYYK